MAEGFAMAEVLQLTAREPLKTKLAILLVALHGIHLGLKSVINKVRRKFPKMLEQLNFILRPIDLDFRFREEPIEMYIKDNLLRHI